MYLIEYITDCKNYVKLFPYEEKPHSSKRIYWRNVLYINAQPKYFLGRVISKIITSFDFMR